LNLEYSSFENLHTGLDIKLSIVEVLDYGKKKAGGARFQVCQCHAPTLYLTAHLLWSAHTETNLAIIGINIAIIGIQLLVFS